MRTAAIVVAAGAGRRLGGVCKALLDLGGRPLLCRSLEALQASPLVDGICVAVPPGQLGRFSGEFASRWPCTKVFAWVEGGERRRDSVRSALEAVPGEAALIAVHDAARPFLDEALLARVVAAAAATGAAVPGIGLTDTIKEIDGGGVVVRTLPRDRLRAVQTPQVFAARLLRRAYREAGADDATDDAALVERLGLPVALVEGSPENIKITAPEDIDRARRILAARGGSGDA
ncbi:MAG: 2-C-methyl-D-erythritol 4-phosphate cytidylyltransferase [bacterium]|nr:2-C-methyl-D-erythritol 4-phosphate cytidylyltransferase [bacterium]